LEVNIDDNKVIALDPNWDYEVTFTLTNKIYRAVRYVSDTNISKKRFLVVLSENKKHTLFKEERIKFYEKVEAATSYEKDKPAKFERIDDQYYLKLSDNMTLVPQNKKRFLRLFPNKEKELKEFIKENKLHPKNEEELIKIVEYISTIMD
jgi:TRAP-type C4-dicarboxylate transport system substrate-binding protein